MASKTDSVRLHRVLSRVEAPAEYGLNNHQVAERLENGYSNFKPDSAEKSVAQIFRDNIFTYLNLLLTVLVMLVAIVGSYQNTMFLGVAFINTTIGIIQELRSRKLLAKMSFITAPNATVIRDGNRVVVPTEETVLDDIALFSGDQQIYADAIVLSGECNVNEALVTGESDEIVKKAGDSLLSGSFVVSGECVARLDKVGRDSFLSQLTIEAKKSKGKLSAGMVSTLRRYVQVLGITIIPLGIAMFIQRMRSVDIELAGITLWDAVADATVRTVAALVGMIPDGLYLLVSMTLTVSVIRLAQRKTLIQERNCVETLARVNVLCVDKTGTITESNMDVKGTVLMCENRFGADDVYSIIADYVGNMPPENETMAAIQAFVNAPPKRRAMKVMPFSSAVKYGGVSFHENESYLIGAPERILQSSFARYRETIDAYSAQGYRVLLLALYDKDIGNALDASRVVPIALILLSNRVRPEAPGTFRFFAEQGVKIIVISGDNPITVSHIALEAGIEGAERFIDAAELTTDRKLRRAVDDYIVFGRVTPDQKRKLVRALKKTGHTVAMTGDGVNDVLALKDANCSIAMASGSEVASQVADIVLLNSDFSAMPAVVMEGRRVINNIERSAALFLVKNIFSFLLALAAIAFMLPFPLDSLTSFTLYNMMLIGAPSFVLAMEPNTNLVKGRFMINVIRNALPAGLTDFITLLVLVILYGNTGMDGEMSTMALIIITFVGFLFLYKLCRPLNALRIALIVTMVIGFVIGSFLLNWLTWLTPLSWENTQITIVFCLASIPLFILLTILMEKLTGKSKRTVPQ